MRRILSVLLLIIATTTISFSQTQKDKLRKKIENEFSLSVGRGSMMRKVFHTVFNLRELVENGSKSPAFNFIYKRTFKDKWFLYGEGGFQQNIEDIKENDIVIGSSNEQFFNLGIGVEYRYVNWRRFKMYSAFSAAYTFQQFKPTYKTDPVSVPALEGSESSYRNYHIKVLGLRFGRKLAAIIELGYGYEGLGTVGLSYRL